MASKREVSIIIRAIDRATRTLKSIGTAAGQGFKRIADNADEAARSLLAVGAATTLALGLAVNTAASFQQEMANSQSVVAATADELAILTDNAREMGKTTVFSARQAAQAIFFLGSAGFSTQKIIGSLEGTLALAAATNSDLAFSAQAVVGNLSAFGLEARESERVANVFSAAIGGSQATMDKLATSLSIIGPVAESVNLSLEETTGILGVLFNRNIDASTAGTALRQAIAQLLKPSEDAKEALGRLTISVLNADNTLRPLVDIVRDLEEAGLSTADAMSIFGVRAGPAMLALVKEGADAIEDFTKSITDTNKAAEMAEIQLNTFQGQVRLLRSAFEEFQISIGNQLLPTLKEYAIIITGIINNTSEWMKQHPVLTEVIVKTTGVIGILLSTLGGGLFVLGSFAKAIISLTAAIGGVATGFVAGIGLATVALTAFIIKAKAAAIQARRTRNAISGKFTAEDVISGVPEAVAEFDALRNEMKETTDKIIVLEQEIERRQAALLVTPHLTGTSFELRMKQMMNSVEVFRERFSSIVNEISKLTIKPSLFKDLIPEFPEVPELAPPPVTGPTEAQIKLAEDLAIARQRLILDTTEFEIKEIERAAAAQIKIAGNNADLISQIVRIRDANIAKLRKEDLDASKLAALEQRNAVIENAQAEKEAIQASVDAFSAAMVARQGIIDNLAVRTLEAEGKMREAAELRLAQELEMLRAAGFTQLELAEFIAASEAAIEERFRVETANKTQQQIDDLTQRRIAAETDLFAKLNSIRGSAFQMEQNRIKQMGQSYTGFIRSAINIGRQFFSAQEEGWIRALASTVRFITRVVAGFLRQRSLEKLKQADQAKTAAQFQIQHGAKMLALGAEAALLSVMAFATGNIASGLALAGAAGVAGEEVIKAGVAAAAFEVQATKLQTEAAGLMIAAVAVESAGAIAAGGLDLAADKVRRNAREQEELARTTERRLDTELRLKQQILELEGRTVEARRLGIGEEVSQLRAMGIDENLIRRFERLSIQQAQQEAGGVVIDTGTPGSRIGDSDIIARPQTIFTQNNTFIGILEIDNQVVLRELAEKLLPFTEELQDLETVP